MNQPNNTQIKHVNTRFFFFFRCLGFTFPKKFSQENPNSPKKKSNFNGEKLAAAATKEAHQTFTDILILINHPSTGESKNHTQIIGKHE